MKKRSPAHLLLGGSCAPVEAPQLYEHAIEEFEEDFALGTAPREEERFTMRQLPAPQRQLQYAS